MSTTFRFVCCADVRLDAPIHCLADGARARLAELGRAAFRRVVDLCHEHRADALLIAGELFDEQRLSLATEDFLVEQVNRLVKGGTTLVLSGTKSACATSLNWPHERVLWLGSNHGDLAIPGPNGKPIAHVIEAEDDPGPDGPPIEPSALVRRAPGTIPSLFMPSARRVGALTGRQFGDAGARGALAVVLPARGEAEVAFHTLSTVRWESVELDDLTEVNDVAALQRLCTQTFHELRSRRPDSRRAEVASSDGPAWMLRFTLHGPCPAALSLQSEEVVGQAAEELCEQFGALCVELDADGVWRPLDHEPYQGQPNLLGIALGVASELGNGDDELLMNLAPAELAGCSDPEAKRAYLRSLLVDAEHSVAEALLREDVR
jgi:DNA repair protein SbcD/Mre11